MAKGCGLRVWVAIGLTLLLPAIGGCSTGEEAGTSTGRDCASNSDEERAQIPRVVGLNLRHATFRLCEAGFSAEPSTNIQGEGNARPLQGTAWRVVLQRPRADAEVPLDAPIHLAVRRVASQDTDTPPTQETVEPSAEPDYDEIAFLATVRAAIPELIDTDDGLIESAEVICSSLRHGDSKDEVGLAWIDIGQEIGLNLDRAIEFAGTLVGAATATYCPEYS